MDIEKITITDMVKDAKAFSEKYDIYLDTYKMEKELRGNFVNHYANTHHGIDISLNFEDEKLINRTETYADVKKILDRVYPDTRNLKMKQMLHEFPLSIEKHYKMRWEAISKYYKTDEEAIAMIENAKNITIKHYLSDIDYKHSERIRWQEDFNDFLRLIFDEQMRFEVDINTNSLSELTEAINGAQDNFVTKFFKNGNVDIRFNNPEHQKTFAEVYIKDLF